MKLHKKFDLLYIAKQGVRVYSIHLDQGNRFSQSRQEESLGEHSSGHKHLEKKTMVGILGTYYHHLHSDSQGRLCHPSKLILLGVGGRMGWGGFAIVS